MVDHLAEHDIEIMWVGGEPTMNPLLYPAVQRAHERGLRQCIFTNGSLFKPEQAQTLFDSELVFVRVSLNAVTPEVHRKHHDYDDRLPFLARLCDRHGHGAIDYLLLRPAFPMVGAQVEVDERTRSLFREHLEPGSRTRRGNHLNRVFREVERLRRSGQIGLVRRWTEDLREVLPRPAHSFFL